MNKKITLLLLMFLITIQSSNIHFYDVVSNYKESPRKLEILEIKDKLPYLRCDIDSFGALVLNKIIINKKEIYISHRIRQFTNEKIFQENMEPFFASNGGSNFLSIYLLFSNRFLLSNNQINNESMYHVFATGSYKNKEYTNTLNKILKQKKMPLLPNNEYSATHLSKIVDNEKNYQKLLSAVNLYQNIKIKKIAGISNKLINIIRFCSKENINKFYLLLPEENKNTAEIILNHYTENKIIIGNPLYINNTDEAVEFCKKLNNQDINEEIIINQKISFDNNNEEEKIQYSICNNLLDYMITTIKNNIIENYHKLNSIRIELRKIIINYSLFKIIIERIDELYTLLEELKLKNNQYLDQLIGIIIMLESIHVNYNKDNTSFIPLQTYFKNQKNPELETFNMLMNYLIKATPHTKKKNNKKYLIVGYDMDSEDINYIILKLEKIIMNHGIKINKKHISEIYELLTMRISDYCYDDALMKFIFKLQTSYFNNHKDTFPLQELESLELTFCLLEPLTKNNISIYNNIYCQVLIDSNNIENKITHLILILEKILDTIKTKEEPIENHTISFIMFLLERLCLNKENIKLILNSLLQLNKYLDENNEYNPIREIVNFKNFYSLTEQKSKYYIISIKADRNDEYQKIKKLYEEQIITFHEFIKIISTYLVQNNSPENTNKDFYLNTNLYPNLDDYLNYCIQYNILINNNIHIYNDICFRLLSNSDNIKNQINYLVILLKLILDTIQSKKSEKSTKLIFYFIIFLLERLCLNKDNIQLILNSLDKYLQLNKYLDENNKYNTIQEIVNFKNFYSLTEQKSKYYITSIKADRNDEYQKIKKLYEEKIITFHEFIKIISTYLVQNNSPEDTNKDFYLNTNLNPNLDDYLKSCIEWNEYIK